MFRIKKENDGFTLIELMVAVTITGILSSLALSGYKDHTARVRIIEGINLVEPLKSKLFQVSNAVELTILADAWNSSDVYNGTFPTSKYVEKINLDSTTGVITIFYNPLTVGVNATENELTYSPYHYLNGSLASFESALTTSTTGTVDFACTSSTSLRVQERGQSAVVSLPANGILTKYAPGECR